MTDEKSCETCAYSQDGLVSVKCRSCIEPYSEWKPRSAEVELHPLFLTPDKKEGEKP